MRKLRQCVRICVFTCKSKQASETHARLECVWLETHDKANLVCVTVPDKARVVRDR